MPRKAHLAKYYSSKELKKKYLNSTDPVESRRWHLLWKISLGWTIKNSAVAIGINYQYAKEIVQHKGDKLEQEIFKANLPLKVEELEREYPEAEIELWFFDEHRIGLKPILKKVWSKIGDRPIAIVSHRYEWVYVYGFVRPKTGESLWYLIPRVNTDWLNLVYQHFAQDAGVSEKKKIFLVEDNAGWHRSKNSVIPEGITINFLPPYSRPVAASREIMAISR